MTYAISVPTPFNDISELAENFASRVDDERLMLPHDQPIPEGEWVQFAVSLADGSPALAGTGRCTGAFDNGEDRAAEHRYDIVMDNLQLDEMAQIYFERVLQMRAAQMGEEPNTGQVEVPPEEPVDAGAVAAAFEEPPAEVAPEAVAAADDDFGGEATQAVSFDELDEAAQAAVADPEHAEAVPVEAVAEAPLEAHAEPSAEAYAEAPAEAYAEAPAEAPIEGHAEQPVEAYAEPADAGAWDEAGAVEPEELSGSEMLESVEEVLDEGAEPAPVRSIEPPTELRIPEQSAIYELPPPSPPGQLPSPHATNGAVLTRRSLTASWSPEPALRHEPMPSSGLFQYAVGAGLPQPAEPPRPDLDPSLRLAPAPRPGDPHAAPAVMTATASEAQTQQAYEPEAYEEASPEAPPQEAAHFGADETMEGLGLPAEEAYAEPAEGYEDAEPMQADEAVVMMDDESMDASMNEAYPAIAEPDAAAPDDASDFDFEDLSDQAAAPAVGDETAVAVELPDDEERG